MFLSFNQCYSDRQNCRGQRGYALHHFRDLGLNQRIILKGSLLFLKYVHRVIQGSINDGSRLCFRLRARKEPNFGTLRSQSPGHFLKAPHYGAGYEVFNTAHIFVSLRSSISKRLKTKQFLTYQILFNAFRGEVSLATMQNDAFAFGSHVMLLI